MRRRRSKKAVAPFVPGDIGPRIGATVPPAAKPRRAKPRKKNVIVMPFFLRNGVKVTVEGDIEDFTWDAKHDRLLISTGVAARLLEDRPHPSARIVGMSSGSVENSGVEYTDNGPSAEESRIGIAVPGSVIPDITMTLEQIMNLNKQAQSIAVEKLQVTHEEVEGSN